MVSRIPLLLTLILGLSCTKQPSEEASTEPIAATYSDINSKIFQAKCLSCHSGGEGSQGIDFTNYASLVNSTSISGGFAVLAGNSGNSRVWIRARPSGGMPPASNGLSQREADAIKSWIDSGAQP